jgi:transcriptional regulator with XRE-family HTH domain
LNEAISRYIVGKMTADELKGWRERMGWTQEKAATELGVSLRGYQWAESKGPRRAMALHAQRIEAAKASA